MSIVIIVNYLLVIAVCVYGVAYFGRKLQAAENSPFYQWIESKHHKLPKYLELVFIFLLAFNLVRFLKYLL